MGAAFGLNYGWEHPLYFDADTPDSAGFARQPWWESVGREARGLRERAGIVDISNFAKYRVAGRGAEDWLNAIFANRMPRAIGRSCLTPLIGKRGGVAGDFTVTRTGEAEFWILGSGMAERFHQRFFRTLALPDGTTFESRTEAMCGFNVAGPHARDIIARLTDAELSNDGFPFFRSANIDVAGVPCLAIRVSFTGDLGWELHCATEDQSRLYDALLDAGRAFGAGPVGSRALMSLRIEKGYGSWGREYSPDWWPQESKLDRLIKADAAFLNRDAWLALRDRAPRETLEVFEIDAAEADASGGEPIFLADGTPVGQVTSGAYGHSVGKSLALGYLKTGAAGPGDTLEIAVLGRPHIARLLQAAPFDPDGLRLRDRAPVPEPAQ